MGGWGKLRIRLKLGTAGAWALLSLAIMIIVMIILYLNLIFQKLADVEKEGDEEKREPQNLGIDRGKFKTWPEKILTIGTGIVRSLLATANRLKNLKWPNLWENMTCLHIIC